MKTKSFQILALIVLAFPLANAVAGDVAVILDLIPRTFKARSAPLFQVQITPTAGPLRIFDFRNNVDLRDNYIDIDVRRQDGKTWETLIGISDVGPIVETDYVNVEGNETYTFRRDARPNDLKQLEPGIYVAQLRVKADWDSEYVHSNEVTFYVEEP